MSLRTRPSAWTTEYAPTSRSRCRHYRQLISKGTAHVRTTACMMPGRTTCFFRHGSGACIGPASAAAILGVYGSVDSVPRAPGLRSGDDATVRNAIADAYGQWRQSVGSASGQRATPAYTLPTSPLGPIKACCVHVQCIQCIILGVQMGPQKFRASPLLTPGCGATL